jgi:hypothetical protein
MRESVVSPSDSSATGTRFGPVSAPAPDGVPAPLSGFFGGSGLRRSAREFGASLRLLRNRSCLERLFRRQPFGFSPGST